MRKIYLQKMKMKKVLSLLMAGVLALCSYTAVSASENEINSPDSSSLIAGNYICFEEEQEGHFTTELKKGILRIEDGRIADISDFEEDREDVLYLDDYCVIFPGLLDLHAHIEYSPVQLWEYTETEVPWDNRHEWISSAEEDEDVRTPQYVLRDSWEEPLKSGTPSGDIVQYFSELQAAAGGTTYIQGYNETEEYDAADSHAKLDLIRSSSDAEDTGRTEIKSLIQLFKPDAELDKEDPSTYLPPIDTKDWNLIFRTDSVTGEEYVSQILSDIENGTSPGYLIHIAEGRAGNFLEEADSYSVKEFDCLKEEILAGIREGRFTFEDVKNAHINLIHACTCDLSNEETYDFIRDCGIGLIWSPVSNLMLYGDTPDFYDHLDDDDLLIGIGSDWSPSGSKNVWDECRFAYDLMQDNAARPENAAESLLKACTIRASRMIGNPDVGNIVPGSYADLFILKGSEETGGSLETALNTFIGTDDSGVQAVLCGGITIYGEEDFIRSVHGDEAFSSYGKYETPAEGLENKYFLLPEFLRGSTLEDIYQEYLEMTEDAGIDLSMIRTTEDPVYEAFIEELKNLY